MSTTILELKDHPIKTVTVFSCKKAEIIRSFKLDLKRGQNEINITGLPSCIDVDASRVTGLGDAVLFDVVCTVSEEPPSSAEAHSAALRALQRELSTIQGVKRVRENEAEILVTYGKSLTGEHNSPDVVSSFLQSFVGHGESTLKAIAEVDAQIEELKTRIADEEHRLNTFKKRAPTGGKITAVIMAQQDRRAEITLTYMVSEAGWTPSYDLRADTENGKPKNLVSLYYRATIKQNTGEDWNDTVIILSTAVPDWSLKLPKLDPMKITPTYTHRGIFGPSLAPQATGAFGAGSSADQQQRMLQLSAMQQHMQQQQQMQQAQAQQQAIAPAPFNFSVNSLGAQAAPPPPPPPQEDLLDVMTESTTVVTEGAVASTYRIQGSCSIPSDDEPHKVAIAVLPFEANISFVSVPRLRAMAFLQCAVTNSTEYRLLPGSVTVYLDNSPVSQTSIKDVNPDEVFRCTLGPDPAIRVSYVKYPKVVETVSSAFSASTTTSKYKNTITIQNKHSFAIPELILRDALPASENDNIRVELIEPKGLADAKGSTLVKARDNVQIRWVKSSGGKPEETEGKYEWVVSIAAGEEINLEAVWQVRAPSNFQFQIS